MNFEIVLQLSALVFIVAAGPLVIVLLSARGEISKIFLGNTSFIARLMRCFYKQRQIAHMDYEALLMRRIAPVIKLKILCTAHQRYISRKRLCIRYSDGR